MAGKVNSEMKYFDFSIEPGKQKTERTSIKGKNPLISVITVCKQEPNHEYILQMMQALENQTFSYWEWIIVLKENKTEIKELMKKDNRVKVIINEFETVAKAMTYAVNNSAGDIIFTFEENDLIDKTMLECGFYTFRFNKEVSLAFSNVVEFGKKENLINSRIKISDLKKKNVIPASIFIKKEKFFEVENIENVSDCFPLEWYIAIDLLSRGNTILKMNYYGYWHRNSKKTIQDKSEKDRFKEGLKSKLDKIDSTSEIIQFDNNYEVDYADIPQIIDFKPMVPKNEKKRLLFIIPWAAFGGAEIFDRNLIKGLRQKGYEISVITTQKSEYELRQNIEQYVDEYFDLTSFLKRKDWTSFISYIIRSRKIDLVMFTNSFYGYYALPWLKCQFKDIPFVDYIHSENWTMRNGGKPKDSNAVADYLDTTYTCTKYLKNVMYNKMNRSNHNIKPVYIGTDTDYFDPKIELKEEKRLKTKYNGKKVIVLPCRVVHAKRPIFAIEVLKRIIEKRDDVRLIIIGDGNALNDVKKYIRKNKMQKLVECPGYKQDVRPYYKIATATILCSLQEGLALITYESLSMGVPIVSADIGGQSELVGKDCGELISVYQKLEEQRDFNYNKEEIQKYADALLSIMDKVETTNIKEKCRQKVVKGFSINTMINTMDREFTNLIKEGSKVDKKLLENTELAERYLQVHSVLDSKEEIGKIKSK